MTVRARMRLPSATASTQHTVARTAVVVRRMRVSTVTRACVERWGGSLDQQGATLLQPCLAWALCLTDFDWVWDDLNKSSATLLSCDNRKVSFHMEYSCGTAAIRGTKELGDGQHFWEIKMTSPVYGTDMVNCQARG